MKKFVLIGAAGFVAKRHMKAIKDVGGELIACIDPHDNVGILDSYFPDALYFREFERFDRFCSDQKIDYVSICSPNYLHNAHCRFALRIGANAICEKPLTLNPKNIDKLKELELSSGRKVWNILQLRLSETALQVKQEISDNIDCLAKVASLEYYTPRGCWYDYSWKTNIEKSGGIATNIGIHLFDLLLWLFGGSCSVLSWYTEPRKAIGQFRIGMFVIKVILSIEKNYLPKRLLTLNGKEFELSKGFKDLHTLSYQKIIDGNGFGIDEVLPAVTLCSQLRHIGTHQANDPT